MVTSSVPDDMPQQVIALTSLTPQPDLGKVEQPAVAVPRELTWAEQKQRGLDSLCSQALFLSSQLGIYVYDLTEQKPFYGRNITQRMRPASCQKLVTSIAALHYLGGDYQFKTHLYTTGDVLGHVLKGDVYVVGSMDPMLSAEELTAMARILKQKGINQVGGSLFVDLSMKDDKPLGWGWSWDDDYGPLSALMVAGRDEFSERWPKTLAAAGIRLNQSRVAQRELPRGAKLAGTVSRAIDEVLRPMMKKSENIYAESVFYQIAASGGQKGASRQHAQAKIGNLLTQLGVPGESYTVADGSGLSPYNYLTAEMLVALLNFAYSRPAIFEHLYPSLPVAGVDGTLERRMVGTPAAGNVHAKTGTVTGVSSLAGYLTAANGHLLSFSILNQGVSQASLGREFQNQVCSYLCQ
jgi:D-alanyl-D-alanine carboxypeptidase/D-alanyl-D-alanine-endopeptidase (penicillin-binding protein 4)